MGFERGQGGVVGVVCVIGGFRVKIMGLLTACESEGLLWISHVSFPGVEPVNRLAGFFPLRLCLRDRHFSRRSNEYLSIRPGEVS